MSKTALITGASRGIGSAIARRFAGDGYSLSLCCSHSGTQLKELAHDLHQEYGISVQTHIGDVGSYDFVKKMVSDTLASFGSLDLLINNAGISYVGLLSDMSPGEWDRILSVNLTGVFYTCKCVIPSMLHRKKGKIINISSIWGSRGASCEAAYSASKGGIDALTRALGKELAPSNIQVNAIACGMIDTEMNRIFSEEEIDQITDEIPCGRMGTPQEAAELVWLICHSPNYLNAQIITLDGAWM